ncbi:hypothetical protein [Escherichia coli]|uniref:Uncharacterized protein n=1 Tax=Escherichia coli TaxID=562 RepID=A0A6D0K481_ECOLX|nr:hypothetical protein [Escherichia coli]MWR22440.1 hypothetical protein [Escherichia coli]MWR99537.1 hypothetical protein [Escherichia coli]MWS04294.1 hypothetical protein [Escherichia coli]MWS41928.1 hypothetical protein [Escherichia coli]MWS52088.1 hypothetical protein [Escherichia coli]
MMKKWLFCLVGVIFSCSALAQTEEQAQKELKRYQDMKPQVEQLLRESLKLYYDMPDAASEYNNGNPEKWRKVITGLKEFDKQIETIGGNGFDPVYGSCVKMGIQLQDYWSNVIGSNKQFLERSRSLFIQDRMDCFDQFVFGKERIEARKGLAIVNVWDE